MKKPKKVIDAFHYENAKGEAVEFCECCTKWKPAENMVSCEDGDLCRECLHELVVTGSE